MKKINLGVVLILITLITLTTYIIYDENSKAKDRENIKSFLDEYFVVCNKYYMLEKEARNIDKTPDVNEYNTYLSELKSDLSKYVLDSKLNDIYDIYKQRLDKQFCGQYMINDYNIEINGVIEDDFKDSYISVVLDSTFTINRDERVNSTIDKNTGRYEGRVRNLSTTIRSINFIVLEKIGGEFKIVMHIMSDIVLGYTKSDIGGI